MRLIDAQGQGTVRHVKGLSVTVEMDGIEMTFSARELVKVEFDTLMRGAGPGGSKAADKADAAEARNRLKNMQASREAVYELDLHIHELLDHYEHMTNAQILEYQMTCSKRFLNEARAKKYRKIILIHGVGEGVLRSELHRWLDQLSNIEYHDAPYRTYGYGATVVTLYG